jgi:hypothetical protein
VRCEVNVTNLGHTGTRITQITEEPHNHPNPPTHISTTPASDDPQSGVLSSHHLSSHPSCPSNLVQSFTLHHIDWYRLVSRLKVRFRIRNLPFLPKTYEAPAVHVASQAQLQANSCSPVLTFPRREAAEHGGL